MLIHNVLVGVLLLAGFIWLRLRLRRVPEEHRKRALLGVVLFLVPALLIGKWAFEKLPFSPERNLAVELAVIAAMFIVTIFGFVRSGK